MFKISLLGANHGSAAWESGPLSLINKIPWSLFVDAQPPDKTVPSVQIISLYEDGPWVRVMVGQMLHCTKGLPSVCRGSIFFPYFPHLPPSPSP